MTDLVDGYIAFQGEAQSPFHVVHKLAADLTQDGFKELQLADHWNLESGAGYYVIHREGKTLVSFVVGKESPADSGFAIIAAHTDSPALRLRLNPFSNNPYYRCLQTQVHGGMIFRTWFDRPLVLAGMVYSYPKGKPQFDPQNGLPQISRCLVRSPQPLAVIPELAIHLDREKNNSGPVNPEIMLQAIIGTRGFGDTKRRQLLESLVSTGIDDVQGWELSLAPHWPHVRVGIEGEFVLGPRHDDLAMVYSAHMAMRTAHKQNPFKTSVAAFFDAEETGSQTAGGAGSSFLRDLLGKIVRSTSGDGWDASIARSFVVSADMAHAYHPSFGDRHDENHRPVIGQGLVVKENSNDRYATTGAGVALFKALCEAAGAPCQFFVIRQDAVCGSTVGPILAARLSCPTVDVGLPMWGMHSAAETMGSNDFAHAVRVFETFFCSGVPR